MLPNQPITRRLNLLPDNWIVDMRGDPFETITITAPNGFIAVTTNTDKNPGSILRMLILDLLGEKEE